MSTRHIQSPVPTCAMLFVSARCFTEQWGAARLYNCLHLHSGRPPFVLHLLSPSLVFQALWIVYGLVMAMPFQFIASSWLHHLDRGVKA